MPGGGANHITWEGICLEGEPITSQGREYAWRGSQSHRRGGNMPGGGANHITGEGICMEGEPITSQGRDMHEGGTNHITGEGICMEEEPITSQGREYAWRGGQCHHRGGNMPGGGQSCYTNVPPGARAFAAACARERSAPRACWAGGGSPRGRAPSQRPFDPAHRSNGSQREP
eukprot:1181618-Prorocentrum_minimum.AAC.1